MPDNNGLAATTPQNAVLDGLNQFTQSLTSLGQGAANIYSTFLGAKTTYDLAKSQKEVNPSTPNFSPANTVEALMQNKVVSIGVIVALGATAYLIYKAVK